MKAKDNRLQTIQNILLERNVSTQEELLSELAHHGFSLTQATLSRDLKKLKIAKLHTEEGVYRYSLPQASSNKVSDVLKDSPGFPWPFPATWLFCVQNLVMRRHLPVKLTLPTVSCFSGL